MTLSLDDETREALGYGCALESWQGMRIGRARSVFAREGWSARSEERAPRVRVAPEDRPERNRKRAAAWRAALTDEVRRKLQREYAARSRAKRRCS